MYGQLATDVDFQPTQRTLTFTLTPDAKWHSGEPITAPSLKNLFVHLKKTAMHPQLQLILKQIAQIETPNDQTLILTLTEGAIPLQQIPFMIGGLPLIKPDTPLQQAHCGPYQFSVPPQPYEVTLKKRPQFWGNDLPVNKGRFNFDQITLKWYRTPLVLMEAFKKGEVDFVSLTDPELRQSLKTDHSFPYTFSAFKHERPIGMEAFVFNTRHPFFHDEKTRLALALLFDFDWYNKHYYHDQYHRIESYFENTVFQNKKTLPSYLLTGSKRDRFNSAKKLLAEAGWVLKNGRLYSPSLKQYFDITLLLPHFHYMKVAQGWAKELEKLGITLHIKRLESGLFEKHKHHLDFDIILHKWPLGHTPGHEIMHYFSSDTALLKGTQNIAGVHHNAIDQAIKKALSETQTCGREAAFQSLDALLMQACYGVPLFYMPKDLIAHRTNLAYPENSTFSPSIVVWWNKDAQATGE